MFRGAFLTGVLAGFVVQSNATIYSVTTSSGYSASYDTAVNGFTSWSSGGGNQLALQTLYYSLNNGSLSQLTGSSVGTSSTLGGSKSITATYTIPGIGTVANTLTLNGNTLGQGIVFNNTSGVQQTISLFQYSDFVVGGPAATGSQNLSIVPSFDTSSYAVATQTGGGATLTWSGHAPGYSTLVQASSSGAPFGPFIGFGTDLDNTTVTASGNAVFGYEFTGMVGAGNSLTVSEVSSFPVPEPSTAGLMVTGILAWLWLRRRTGEGHFPHTSGYPRLSKL